MPEYSVRLVIRVAADSPERASQTFITHLVENGMTDWVYQVCDPETAAAIGYFDGFGLPVDVNDLPSGRDQQQEVAEPTPEATPAAPTPEQTPVQTESDEQLLTLAQELNDADAPPPQE